MRFIDTKRLVLATHNKGKLVEFADMLDLYVQNLIAAGDLHLPEPEETGTTFAENAILKAKAAAIGSDGVALADDSGLCVTALHDEPGIYSARWAGPEKDFAAAMKAIHQKLEGTTDRSAHFICMLALAWPDGHTETIEGRVDGHLIWPPRGDKGLGYDPIFVPLGHERTFAEMEPEEKHAISHRGIAVRKLIARLQQD